MTSHFYAFQLSKERVNKMSDYAGKEKLETTFVLPRTELVMPMSVMVKKFNLYKTVQQYSAFSFRPGSK